MGTTERRQREKERKENEIVQAARELFFEKGYGSTSVDDIASKLEISKGSVYLHFANKDELYYAVAKEGLLIIKEMFARALSTPGTGLDRLTAIGRAYIDFWSAQPEYRRLFHDTKVGVPPLRSGPRGIEFARTGAEANAIMIEAIRMGIEDGSIRRDVEPEKLAFCASSMVDGILERMERKVDGGLEREEALTYAFELMRRAVESPRSSRSAGPSASAVGVRAKAIKKRR